MKMEKNDSAVVAHLPKDSQLEFERLAELEGICKSELARILILQYIDKKRTDFRLMKTIFERN